MDELRPEGKVHLGAVRDAAAVLGGQVGGGNPQYHVLFPGRHVQMDLAAHHLGHIHLAGDGVASGILCKGNVLGTHAQGHVHGRDPSGSQSLAGLLRQRHHRAGHRRLIGVARLLQLGVEEIHLGGTDKARHKNVGRMVKDLLRRADLHDEAVLHDHDAVAQRHGLGLVMRYVNKGGVDALTKLDDLRAHLVAQLGVQIGQRFVHQEDLRVPNDGAADGDTLPLAAGERLGLAVQILGDIQDLGRLTDLPVDFVLGRLAQLQGEGHVFIDRHVRVERVVLEDHGDIPVLGFHVVHPLVADEQVALGDVLQSGHHPQGGGLAAAGGAYQHDEFLIRDLQIKVVDGGHLVVVDLFDVLQGHSCHAHGP